MRLRRPADVLDMAQGMIGGPGDPLVVGTDESRAAARQELRRQQRVTLAPMSKWKELAARDLVFNRRVVEHSPTGEKHRVHRGEVLDVAYTPISAYVLTDGDVVFLEPAR